MEIASNVAFAKESHTTLFWKGTGFYIKTKDLSAHESSQTQISRFEKKGKESIAERQINNPITWHHSFITLTLSVLGMGGPIRPKLRPKNASVAFLSP